MIYQNNQLLFCANLRPVNGHNLLLQNFFCLKSLYLFLAVVILEGDMGEVISKISLFQAQREVVLHRIYR